MFASDTAASIKLLQIKLLHGTNIGRMVNKAEAVRAARIAWCTGPTQEAFCV